MRCFFYAEAVFMVVQYWNGLLLVRFHGRTSLMNLGLSLPTLSFVNTDLNSAAACV